MKIVEEVRRQRLEMLVAEFGSLVALNGKLGLDKRDSTLSQYRNRSENSKSGTPKAMGSDVARRLEHSCGKEEGWMDTDPSLWPFERVDHSKLAKLTAEERAQIQFGILTAASMAGIDIEKRTGTTG